MGLKLVRSSLPCRAGMGLRAPHYQEVLSAPPNLGWVEVHSENFFDGGLPLHTLRQVRSRYPVSLHGVGLGLGSPDPLNWAHLRSLKKLMEVVEPAAISEHLSWNAVGGTVINDLLPFPLTEDSLRHVVGRIDQVQNFLGRVLLIENLSQYLTFAQSTLDEGEFLAELFRRSGCGILFDVNNLYVNQQNLGVDPLKFMRALPAEAIEEYHLAGYSQQAGGLVDTHSTPVSAPVWALFQTVLAQWGPRPTLIEWDQDLPPLEDLLGQVSIAQRYLDESRATIAPQEWQETVRQLGEQINQRSPVLGAGSERLGVTEEAWGLTVYRNNLRENLSSALKGAYPVLFQLVGEDFFRYLGENYRLRYPSRQGNLHCYGEVLAVFLREFPAVAQWPWFSSVAELEWACHRAYFAEDTPMLNLERLAEVDLGRYAALLHFKVAPATTLLTLEYPVTEVWRLHQHPLPEDFTLTLNPGIERALVFRHAGVVDIRLLTEPETRWWQLIKEGKTLAQILEGLSAEFPDFKVQPILVEAVGQGLLVDFSVERND